MIVYTPAAKLKAGENGETATAVKASPLGSLSQKLNCLKVTLVDWMLFISEQWLLIAILCAAGSALIFVEGQRSGKSLSYHDVTHMVNNNLAVLLDVRESKDFSSGHIVGAINIPYTKLSERNDELKKHSEKTIIIVDKMGQHAGAAGKQLKQKGYQVNRLQGGMTEWTSQNLPVVKG